MSGRRYAGQPRMGSLRWSYCACFRALKRARERLAPRPIWTSRDSFRSSRPASTAASPGIDWPRRGRGRTPGLGVFGARAARLRLMLLGIGTAPLSCGRQVRRRPRCEDHQRPLRDVRVRLRLEVSGSSTACPSNTNVTSLDSTRRGAGSKRRLRGSVASRSLSRRSSTSSCRSPSVIIRCTPVSALVRLTRRRTSAPLAAAGHRRGLRP